MRSALAPVERALSLCPICLCHLGRWVFRPGFVCRESGGSTHEHAVQIARPGADQVVGRLRAVIRRYPDACQKMPSQSVRRLRRLTPVRHPSTTSRRLEMPSPNAADQAGRTTSRQVGHSASIAGPSLRSYRAGVVLVGSTSGSPGRYPASWWWRSWDGSPRKRGTA